MVEAAGGGGGGGGGDGDLGFSHPRSDDRRRRVVSDSCDEPFVELEDMDWARCTPRCGFGWLVGWAPEPRGTVKLERGGEGDSSSSCTKSAERVLGGLELVARVGHLIIPGSRPPDRVTGVREGGVSFFCFPRPRVAVREI